MKAFILEYRFLQMNKFSAAHFLCFKFFAKNDKNWSIFREKRKIYEKFEM